MVSNNFVFTAQAKIDIEQAFDYIVNEFGDKFAVKILYDELFDAIQRICLFPKSSELVDNELIKKDNVRKTLVNNYLLFYFYDENKSMIVILRFIYGKRSFVDLLKEIAI